MSTVYVRWYGQILQGEVVENNEEGILASMVAVRIQIQGMHATALFMPGHVYTSPEQISEKSSINFQKLEKVDQKPQEIAQNKANISINDIMPADDRNMIDAFKRNNWDHDHNHLRIDKLDEFYQLWRMVMRPFGFTDTESSVTLPSHKEKQVSAEAVPQYETPSKPLESLKPVIQKQSKKMMRSTGTQQFYDATQLSLFE